MLSFIRAVNNIVIGNTSSERRQANIVVITEQNANVDNYLESMIFRAIKANTDYKIYVSKAAGTNILKENILNLQAVQLGLSQGRGNINIETDIDLYFVYDIKKYESKSTLLLSLRIIKPDQEIVDYISIKITNPENTVIEVNNAVKMIFNNDKKSINRVNYENISKELATIKDIKGQKLLDIAEKMNLTMGAEYRKEVLNDNKYSGVPQLIRGLYLLSKVECFESFKIPDDGKIPLENIAQTFAENLSKGQICEVTEQNIYLDFSNLLRLREAVLYRWNEKNDRRYPKLNFNDIVER